MSAWHNKSSQLALKLSMIPQDVGEKLAHAVKTGDSVVVELDFKESIAHPDDRYSVQILWKGGCLA